MANNTAISSRFTEHPNRFVEALPAKNSNSGLNKLFSSVSGKSKRNQALSSFSARSPLLIYPYPHSPSERKSIFQKARNVFESNSGSERQSSSAPFKVGLNSTKRNPSIDSGIGSDSECNRSLEYSKPILATPTHALIDANHRLSTKKPLEEKTKDKQTKPDHASACKPKKVGQSSNTPSRNTPILSQDSRSHHDASFSKVNVKAKIEDYQNNINHTQFKAKRDAIMHSPTTIKTFSEAINKALNIFRASNHGKGIPNKPDTRSASNEKSSANERLSNRSNVQIYRF